MKSISARDYSLLPIIPLICLVKVSSYSKPISAQCEMIILESLVEFGISDPEPYSIDVILRSRIDQGDIVYLYHLRDKLEEVAAEHSNYLRRLLSYADKICCLDMSGVDNIYKAIMMRNIIKTLSISDDDLADYPILKVMVSETLKNDSDMAKVKHSIQTQIVKENCDILPPLSLDEILPTISIEGVVVHFADGVDCITSDRFVTALAASLSLDIHEKKRVLIAAPTLSTFQVEQLMITFEEELSQFYDLEKEHPDYIHRRSIKQRIEWLELKEEIAEISA